MWIRVMLCVAVATVLAGDVSAQCRVEGVVRTLAGAPVEGATVVLDPPLRKTTTDAAGRYGFDDVKAGSRIRVSALQGGRELAWEFSLVTRRVEPIDLAERPAPLVPVAVAFNDVRGVVRRVGGRPLADATVTVEEPRLSITTDAAGRYALPNVPAGIPVVMHASAAGFDPATQEVVVPAKQVFDADFTLSDSTPTPSPSAPAKSRSARTRSAKGEASQPEASKPEFAEDSDSGTLVGSDHVSLRPEQVKGLPSLVGKDVFRALQLLPGVTGTHEATSGLMVRGGTPDQTLISYDGITLYNVDDVFGFYSAVNMEGIQAADFTRSNNTAGDGGRLSGALRLTGESKAAAGPTGFVEMSTFGVGGLISVPLGHDASFLLAGRRSNPASLFDHALDWMDVGGIHAARGLPVAYSGGILRAPADSQFHDLNGTFTLRPSSRDQLSVTGYDGMTVLDGSHDVNWSNSAITAQSTGQLITPSNAVSHSADVQDSTSRGVGGHWSHQWSSSTATTLTVGRSEYSDNRDRASTLVDLATGIDYSVLAGRGGNSASQESTDIRDTTVRLEALIAGGFAHALSIGGELTSLDIAYAANREVITGKNPDGTYSQQLAPFLDRSGSGRLMTFFAQDAWRPTPRFTLSPGLRVTRYDVTNTSYTEPRLNVSYQATSLMRINGGWGIDHQFVNRVTHEDLVQGDSAFWTLADGATVPVARSQQIFGGASVETVNVLVDVQAYHRTLDDVAMFAPRLILGAPLAVGASGMRLGSGTARGLEVLVQQRSSTNNAWISYTLSKVEYTFPTLEPNAFPGSEDRPHELKVAEIARLGSRLRIGATWMLASGQPTTPVAGVVQAWWPTGLVVYQPEFGPKNSDRVDTYHRLDLSTQFEFKMTGVRSTVGVSVLNVYNRQNTSLREYQGVGATAFINDVSLMGRAINVFARIGF